MLQPPLVPFVTGPGNILSKSKSKFAVTLKDQFFCIRMLKDQFFFIRMLKDEFFFI